MTAATAAARAAVVLALLVAATATPAAAWPRLCLPPVFEDGQRLHQLPSPNAFWLQLLLRQHQLCWYRPTHPHEQRVALFGNSAVFGLPLPAEQALAGRLNQHFAEQDVAARAFNLAWICPYQVRDAVVLHEALAYRPDILVFALTLDDFGHVAPVPYPPALIEFFRSNPGALAPMVADPPAGLAEPLRRYGTWLAEVAATRDRFERLREVGRFARIAARQYARALARRLHVVLREPPLETTGRQTRYDCAKTQRENAARFADWQSWNVLAYLQQLHEQRGIDVLVVNWPIAHEPVGACYNVRYGNRWVAEFNPWLGAQAAERGLAYLDLHDLLPPELFLDSLHPTPAGHARIAERVAAALAPIIAQRVAAAAGTDGGA